MSYGTHCKASNAGKLLYLGFVAFVSQFVVSICVVIDSAINLLFQHIFALWDDALQAANVGKVVY